MAFAAADVLYRAISTNFGVSDGVVGCHGGALAHQSTLCEPLNCRLLCASSPLGMAPMFC